METSALVLGGGMAGLAAADSLSSEGFTVVVLEARKRLGGRIHTIQSRRGAIPIELGAEFVHGSRNETWRLIRGAGLATHEVTDAHWESRHGVLIRNPEFWERLSKATEKIDCERPDEDFATYLSRQKHLDESARWLATQYVEGFHAAPADMMSVHALKRAEERAEAEEGTRQFRLSGGYSELAEWLCARIESRGSKVICNQPVRIVRWKRNHVEVVAETSDGLQKHQARTAIITLPLGVLQAEPEEGVFFDPELPGKRTPIMSLQMGSVIRITLQFAHRFWPVENFGFIHSADELFPVWWSDERGPILTGWAGARRAEWLAREDTRAICAEAVVSLSRILGMKSSFVENKLQAHYFHNWISDPFSRGAYSFTPARMTKMACELAEPISGTLFFAGEATDMEGNQGTVQGAFKSGERAANEILRVLRRRRRIRVH